DQGCDTGQQIVTLFLQKLHELANRFDIIEQAEQGKSEHYKQAELFERRRVGILPQEPPADYAANRINPENNQIGNHRPPCMVHLPCRSPALLNSVDTLSRASALMIQYSAGGDLGCQGAVGEDHEKKYSQAA